MVAVAGTGVLLGSDVTVEVLLVTGIALRLVVNERWRRLCGGSEQEANGILMVVDGFHLVIGADRDLANMSRLKGADDDVSMFDTEWQIEDGGTSGIYANYLPSCQFIKYNISCIMYGMNLVLIVLRYVMSIDLLMS